MKLLVRSVLLCVLRFLFLTLVISALLNFDVSPLPFWTLIATAYLAHFFITYLFARWAFHRRAATQNQILLVILVFLLLGTAIELTLYLWANPTSLLTAMQKNFNGQSVILVVVYVLAVLVAGYRARRSFVQTGLPEGLE